MLTFIKPTEPHEFDAVRQLCWEYRAFLEALGGKNAEVTLAFYPHDKYSQLMETLDHAHCPPTGGIRLALKDGEPVGCGMFHTIAPHTAEIKRVFVSDKARGTGVGRALMEVLISDIRDQGFSRILMDTGKVLETATQLYLSMGFRQRGPYQPIPEIARDLLVYFEMEL